MGDRLPSGDGGGIAVTADPVIFVQRRIPTYDGVIRTTRATDVVRSRLEAWFTASRQPLKGLVLFDRRFFGEFDGENSFVVHFSVSDGHSSFRPLIDGYLVANELGGCDVVFRASYPQYSWVISVFILVVVASNLFASGGKLGDLLFLFAMAGALAALTYIPLWLEGAAFAKRMRSRLAEGDRRR